jgi:hypothetical protein
MVMADNLTGTVARIFPSRTSTAIRLHVPAGTVEPKDGLFHLRFDHPNYNALYSLALVAAVNRYSLQIDANVEIDPDVEADIDYMKVNWAP